MKRPLIFGFDGGGTKTMAWLAEVQPGGSSFEVLGRGIGGSGNLNNVSPTEGRRALNQARSSAFQDARLPEQPVAAACLGLAGIWSGNNRQIVQAWADSTGLTASGQLEITSDIRILLTAGTPADWGVGLICGTGSCAIGKRPDGDHITVGGWGSEIGDEGSAFALGYAACRVICRVIDGRIRQETRLTVSLMEHFQASSPRAVIDRIYQSKPNRTTFYADLAPLVLDAVAQNDQLATTIVAEQADELALMVRAALEKLELPLLDTPLALTGSTLLKSPFYRELLDSALAQQSVWPEPVTPVEFPVIGALRRALALL